jgi:hypothetical protein
LQKSLVRSDFEAKGGAGVQPTGISPNLVRLLTTAAPDLAAELFTPGRVLEADVVSVFKDRAVLAFGRGVRLEVALQTPLQEGQRVRVQVQPQPAPAQAQGQAAAPGQAQGQAQPAPGQAQGQAQPAPIVLKVVGSAPPPDAQGAPAAAQRPGALRDIAATALPGQPAPVAGPAGTQAPAQAQQPAVPQVLWLPIPLPGGNQGWAQIHIQEDDSPKARALKGGPIRQVRIWWETPALGPVQVTLEAAATNLSAIFTPAAADSKGLLDQSIGDLQQRLALAGFPEARVGSRAPAPGEAIEPARIDGASRLDKRL